MNRPLKLNALVKKWGQLRAPHRFSPLLEPKPTPEQVAKAREAMNEVIGDGGLLGRFHAPGSHPRHHPSPDHPRD